MKTVLILDGDLSFGFWLGQGLDEAGYQVFPAKCVADADALPAELKADLDLVILDPSLPGAADLIETCRRWNESVKVVALMGDHVQSPGTAARVDLFCRKPDPRQSHRRLRWIQRTEALLPVSLFQKKASAAEREGPLPFEKLESWLWEHVCELASRQATAEPSPSTESEDQLAERKEDWNEWPGRVLDGKFELQRLLGVSDGSAVFLTRYGDEPQPAAIKIVRADSANREAVLSRWRQTAQLTHPGLIRLFGAGSCNVGGIEVLYVVMEYAEENLAEVLHERRLSPEEARELLAPVLETLEYLHSRGLVHGRLKPSNILAIGDQVKIAGEWIRPTNERSWSLATAGAYDPPESAAGVLLPPGDVWALGVTMVEALTQQLPIQKGKKRKKAALPQDLPPAFVEVIRRCLQANPRKRETAAGLALQLQKRSAIPPKPARAIRETVAPRWSYALPVVALFLAIAAMLTGSGILRQAQPVPAVEPARDAVRSERASGTAGEAHSSETPPDTAKPPSPPAARQIALQVLPQVSSEALETIEGTLQVSVRAQVDSSGRVTRATLDTPGPSRYFAGRSLKAAENWRFEPVAAPDSSEEWLLRFDYSPTGAKVLAERVNP